MWQTKPGPVSVEITQDLIDDQVWLDSTQMASLKRNGNQLTAAFFETGIVLIARRSLARQEYYLNFEIYIPEDEFSEKTRGFLGNLDGDPTNDLYRRVSPTTFTPLPDTLSDAELYSHLLTCMLITNYSYCDS